MKLSVLMPVFNERATLENAVARVLAVDFPCDMELVIVDDGSTDGTRDLYASLADPRLSVTLHATTTGDYLIMCDADLEYAPEEIPKLLKPVIKGAATIVYGTRTFSSHTAYSFVYVLGNRGVTLAANVLFNAFISDLETCFKLMPTAFYRELDIRERGFGMEAEITAKILGRGLRPHEIPISYAARSREDGKKLTWRDGVEALVILTRERWRSHGSRNP